MPKNSTLSKYRRADQNCSYICTEPGGVQKNLLLPSSLVPLSVLAFLEECVTHRLFGMRAGKLLVKLFWKEYFQYLNPYISRTNETTRRIRKYFYAVIFLDKRKLFCSDKANGGEDFVSVIVLE
jgi:hypothetical protein